MALGGGSQNADSWVLVLSDGMGNHGLTEPMPMRRHASGLAERGIRTITVGIGSDYQADQLTALAEGGQGEFHHASQPDEIVEIVKSADGDVKKAARELVDAANAHGGEDNITVLLLRFEE